MVGGGPVVAGEQGPNLFRRAKADRPVVISILIDGGGGKQRQTDRNFGPTARLRRINLEELLFAVSRSRDDGEVILDREIEQFVGNFQRPPLEQAIVSQLQQQIAGLATA
jgi:hypothetical protein